MKLIWTYVNIDFKNKLYDNFKMTLKKKMILISYYIESIKSAKKLGYYCIIYTNKECFKYFEDLVVEILLIENYESVLFDGIKTHVLGTREDDYCLIDGDLILNKKLPKFEAEIVFDRYEMGNWTYGYKPTIDIFSNLGIEKYIDIWDTQKVPIINTGLIYVKDKNLRKDWLRYSNICDEFIKKNNFEGFDIYSAGLIAGQYLFTLCVNKSKLEIMEFFNINDEYYTHHAGTVKYEKPLFPYKHLMENELKDIKKTII